MTELQNSTHFFISDVISDDSTYLASELSRKHARSDRRPCAQFPHWAPRRAVHHRVEPCRKCARSDRQQHAPFVTGLRGRGALLLETRIDFARAVKSWERAVESSMDF